MSIKHKKNILYVSSVELCFESLELENTLGSVQELRIFC
jgi:hypothetical protein